jgi:hypothetical protein
LVLLAKLPLRSGKATVIDSGRIMFGLNNRREVERVLCRLLSRTAFDRLDARGESRSCQVLPVLLAPDADGEPAAGEPACGLITDLSSRGVGVYAQRLIQAEHLFVGMRLDEDVHVLRGRVASNRFAGGGFYRIGLALLQVLPPSRMGAMECFRALAANLNAPECFAPTV